jgi:hypothetical protein
MTSWFLHIYSLTSMLLRNSLAATGALVKASQDIHSTHSMSKAIQCSGSNNAEYVSEEILTA